MSSGGQQVLINALRPGDLLLREMDEDLGEGDASLRYVVAAYPVVEPIPLHGRMLELEPGKPTFCERFFGDEAAMAEGSPLHALVAGRAVRRPPVLLILGGGDTIIDPHFCDAFVDAYRHAGGSIERAIYEGMPHSFLHRRIGEPEAQRALGDAAASIRSHSTVEATAAS